MSEQRSQRFAGFTDPRNQAADYTLLRTNHTHVVRTFGSFDLPVGPGKSSRRKQSWRSGPRHRRLADELDCQPPVGGPTNDRWRKACSMASGLRTRYGRSISKEPAASTGQMARIPEIYFGDSFQKSPDPQCAAIDASLQAFCTLQAVALKIGKYHPAERTARYARQCRPEHDRRGGSLECGYGSDEEFQNPRKSQRHRPHGCPKRLQSSDAGCASCRHSPPLPLMAARSSISTTRTRSETCPLKGASAGYWSPSQRKFQLKVRLDF